MKNGAYELVIAPPAYPGKRYRGKYCYEHHLVYWQVTGTVINTKTEQIHHKDENKRNNKPDNLELLSLETHRKHHSDIKSIEASKKHGIFRSYRTRGCRCPICVSWWEANKSKYNKERREKRAYSRARTGQIHGTRNSYIYYRCRCLLCREAQAKYMRTFKMLARRESNPD